MNNINQWNVAFGLHYTKLEESPKKGKRKPRVDRYVPKKRIIGMTRKASNKLNEEILGLLKSGLETNEDIYNSLKQGGKLPSMDGKYMDITCLHYRIKKVRDNNGFKKTEKREKILAMLAAGAYKSTIRATIKVSRSYLDDICRHRIVKACETPISGK